MTTGLEDIHDFQRRFTLYGWCQSLGGLAVSAAVFWALSRNPDLTTFDPLVAAIFALGLFTLPWILFEFPPETRRLAGIISVVFLGVCLVLLWVNDPFWSVRSFSVMLAVFALGHGLLLLLRRRVVHPDPERFLRYQRSEFLRMLSALCVNEAALFLGAGWFWIGSLAARILLNRLIPLAVARKTP